MTARTRTPMLTASHLTICGSLPRVASPMRFAARAIAAQSAGFDAMSLTALEFQRELDEGATPSELRSVADDAGIVVDEVEFLVDWTRDGEPGRAARAREATLYAMADAFGSTRLHVGEFDEVGPLPPFDAVAESFGGLCDRAADHGLRVGLEFVPYSPIASLSDALAIVTTAGRANGGVVIDTWHCDRAGVSLETLSAVDPALVVSIQLADAGPLEGSIREDTIHRRLPPGEGSIDVGGYLRALARCGAAGVPVDVEIVSDAQRALPLPDAAARAAQAGREALAKGWKT